MKSKVMETIESVDKKICTGCGACYNACPKEAIKMQPDGEGFLFPVIDHNKCVDCGICLKSCAAYNPHYKNEKEPKCYAVWASDEIRVKSSSGGMFTLMANYVLEQGGYVCGAAWDRNFNLEHIVIHDKEDLDRLRYSKYVQSNTKKVYSEVGKLLKEGHKVLFTGTPCQVAGMYNYLKGDDENLVTADVVCHGTPSQKVWQDFLDTLPYKNEIAAVNFRPKEDGWGVFRLTFTLKDGRKIKLERNNAYFLGFEKALFYRRSCGTCPFNHLPRQADITLGDFWGIHAIDRKLNHKKGTSCILVNSVKGREIFNLLTSRMALVRQTELEPSIKYNRCIYAPSSIVEYKRARFFSLRRNSSFHKAVDFSLNNKQDIGIVGIWFYENYGAILTVYALYKLLESMGFYSILIDFSGFRNIPRLQLPDTLSRRFMRRNRVPVSGIKSTKKDLLPLNQIIENFVVASDQLWRYPSHFRNTTLLDFVDDTKRKVTIASSFGEDYSDSPGEWSRARFHMQRLDRVSVREEKAVKICESIFGVKAQQVLDPVFLCGTSVYTDLIKKSKVSTKGKYLLSYIMDNSDETMQNVQQIADKLGLKLIQLTDADVYKYGANAQQNVEPEDWLYHFKHAAAVVTDSFHGTCFAMLFHTPFLTLVNQTRGASRFDSLMKVFQEEERLLTDAEQLAKHLDSLKTFDASKFESILFERREHDLAWIHEALTFDKQAKSISTYDILSKELVALHDASSPQPGIPSLTLHPSNEDIFFLFNRWRIIRKYQKYRIMKEITWGKRRVKYKIKYQEAKEKLRKLKDAIRKYRNAV